MSSFWNYCMERSSNSFGTSPFTLDSASVINKVLRDIGDSRTFEIFIIHSTDFCLNSLPTFFVQTMRVLIYHFTSVLWTWAIKCPRFVEAFFLWRYALGMLHWSKSLIAWTFFDLIYLMEMIKWTQYWIWQKFSIFCLFLFITNRCCMGNIFFFCSCQVITVGPPGTDHITTHDLASWPELRVTEDAHENLD